MNDDVVGGQTFAEALAELQGILTQLENSSRADGGGGGGRRPMMSAGQSTNDISLGFLTLYNLMNALLGPVEEAPNWSNENRQQAFAAIGVFLIQLTADVPASPYRVRFSKEALQALCSALSPLAPAKP